MYSIIIKDHIMVAHSLPDPFFGPAQNMHGATYNIDAEFFSKELNEQNVVMDIGEAMSIVNDVLHPLNYQNLDEKVDFKGKLTTTEFLAKHIHDELKKKVASHISLKIVLHESHVASASYSGV